MVYEPYISISMFYINWYIYGWELLVLYFPHRPSDLSTTSACCRIYTSMTSFSITSPALEASWPAGTYTPSKNNNNDNNNNKPANKKSSPSSVRWRHFLSLCPIHTNPTPPGRIFLRLACVVPCRIFPPSPPQEFAPFPFLASCGKWRHISMICLLWRRQQIS